MTLEEIERLAAGAERIAAYQRYVEEHANHPLAWFNYAVELERADQHAVARRAAARVRELSADLYRLLPRPVRELADDPAATVPDEREVGGYRITGLRSTTGAQLLFAAVRVADGKPVTVRRVLDASHASARALLEAAQAAPPLPGVAAALAVVEDGDGAPRLVLERQHSDNLRGETRNAAVDADVAVRLIRSAADIVAGMHQAGLVHGDLRPDHVLRDEPGSERVTVIGARKDGDDLPTPYGRLAWQTPEEASGEPPRAASDVYGLGLLLWHLVAGQEPPALDRRAPLPPVAPDWPGLDEIIARATRRDPAARPSAAELMTALDDLMVRRELPPVVGKWRLGDLLGSGAFGRVFAAENVDIAGLVAAVKVLNPFLARDRELRERFLAEATAASRVEHPNIVRILDGGVLADGTSYLAMEKLVGRDLGAEIAAGPVAAERVLRLGRQVASALAAAHAAGIVHRDLKPSNLFVTRVAGEEHVEVMDFGVALLLGGASPQGLPQTSGGRLWGTPETMAPEQWQSQDPGREVDGRADVYGLGVVLWHALAGRPPFPAKTPAEWQAAHLSTPAPALTGPGVPPRLARLVERMMAKAREQRPTMAEVEAELAAIAAEKAAPPPPPPPPPKKRPDRRWLAIAAGALAVLAIAIVAVRCGGPAPATIDAGVADAVVVDAAVDAPVLADAAPPDAALGLDAGVVGPICSRSHLGCLKRCGRDVELDRCLEVCCDRSYLRACRGGSAIDCAKSACLRGDREVCIWLGVDPPRLTGVTEIPELPPLTTSDPRRDIRDMIIRDRIERAQPR
jgi:serine/threonine protein kinase